MGFLFSNFGGEAYAYDTWYQEYGPHCPDHDPNCFIVNTIAWLDDGCIIANHPGHAQIVSSELVCDLSKYGLSVAPEKLKYMCENCESEEDRGVGVVVTVEGHVIQRVKDIKRCWETKSLPAEKRG